MNKNSFTYKKSGVDINAAEKFVKFISNISSKKKGNKKLKNIGGFGSVSNLPSKLKNPKIVACTDGVGTKIEIANTLNKFDTIGVDLVAMSVNDLIVQGAKPLLFLDYISIDKINPPFGVALPVRFVLPADIVILIFNKLHNLIAIAHSVEFVGLHKIEALPIILDQS